MQAAVPVATSAPTCAADEPLEVTTEFRCRRCGAHMAVVTFTPASTSYMRTVLNYNKRILCYSCYWQTREEQPTAR